MNDIISKDTVLDTVKVTKKVALVSSDKLAKVFEKRHDNVLKLIDKQIISLLTMEESVSKYFIDSSYLTSRGKNFRRFEMTRKGFDLLALSFTGEKAFKYKIYYIDAFHDKDELIREHKIIAKTNSLDTMWLEFREEGKVFRNKLTKVIDDTVVKHRHDIEKKMNDGKYYYHYTTLIYNKLNISLPKGTNPRDVLDKRMLVRLEDMEDKVADMITELSKNNHYKDVYKIIRNNI